MGERSSPRRWVLPELAAGRSLAATLAASCIAILTAPAAFAVNVPIGGTLDLAAADGGVLGTAPGDGLGSSVAFVGDVNGDGVTDEAIGAPGASPNGRRGAGSVYVVFGPLPPAGADVGDLGAAALRIDGPRRGAALGASVAGLGDVNGDGLHDLLIGAPSMSWLGRGGAGAAYVVFGKRDTTPIDVGGLGAGGYRMAGAATGDRAGSAVGALDDIDGDAIREAVIGAPFADPAGRPDAGSAYVVYSAGGTAAVDLAALGVRGYRIDGPAPGAQAGRAVSAAGDMNRDGLGDLLMGAPMSPGADGTAAGAASVVWGQRTPRPLDLAALGADGLTMLGSGAELAGYSVAAVGDRNGDGIADVAVGAPRAAANLRRRSGSVYVIYGRAAPGVIALPGAPTDGFRVDGADPGDNLGSAVAAAGDVNGDTVADILAGASGDDPLGRLSGGAAYIVLGGAPPGPLDLSLAGYRAVRLAGAGEKGFAGLALAGGVNVAGSSRPDVLLGVRSAAAPDGSRRGAALLVAMPELPPMTALSTKACRTAAGRVEVIVDDSGSMKHNDRRLLRRQAIQLMLSKPSNVGRVLGAVEFGSRAAEIFPPLVIGGDAFSAQLNVLLGLLAEHIGANGGQTNYNAAFTVAAQASPDAQIMLTDGGHNVGPDQSAALVHVPTYTVGLGIRERTRSGRRLEAIARRSGGEAFLGVTAADLQPILNHIDSLFACETPFVTVPTSAAPTGPSSPAPGAAPAAPQVPQPVKIDNRHPRAAFTTRVPLRRARLPQSTSMVLSWSNARLHMRIDSIVLRRGKRTALRISPKALRRAANGRVVRVHGVSIRGRRGSTFIALEFRGLDRVHSTRGARAAAVQPWSLDTKTHRGKRKRKGRVSVQSAGRYGRH
jgi:hypothetical protein